MELCYISLKNNNLAGQKFETSNAAKTNKKPTCIAYTNTNKYNIQTCGFHQTLKK